MELFKNLYNEQFFEFFIQSMQEVHSAFDRDVFLEHIYDAEWEGRELKQRMRHITEGLRKCLPRDFEASIQIILSCIDALRKNGLKEHSVEYMFFPDYVECYGIDHLEVSIRAMEEITQFTSCEFAVRPFIIQYPEQMMAQIVAWSSHPNFKVRRLSSEGCRPRLPWAMALPALKKDPAPILPILENLKNDATEFVQKSVANNLNDISKDHPGLVIEIAKRWKGKTKSTDWIVKHASRTLLKQGNAELMQLFGFGGVDDLVLSEFTVATPEVKLGDHLEFSFQLENKARESKKIRLEYGIYYQKANGTLSRKVFKISEKDYPPQSSTLIERKQHFKPITTRVYHPGRHEVSVIINGIEMEKRGFELHLD